MGLVLGLAALALVMFFLGLGIGRWLLPSRPAAALGCRCDCGHSLSVHDKERGNCHAQIKQSYGFGEGYRWVRCSCCQYVGPDPISSVWVPPLPSTEENR